MADFVSPGIVNLRPCIQGEDYDELLEFRDETDALIDFTGSTFEAKAKRAAGSSVVATFVMTSPSPGQVKFSLAKATTATISPNSYQYDMFRVDGAGNKTALTIGRWPVVGGITEV